VEKKCSVLLAEKRRGVKFKTRDGRQEDIPFVHQRLQSWYISGLPE